MGANHFRTRWKREQRGATVVLVAVGMAALLGFAALSIDVSHLFQQQREIQSATDAGALAGAALLLNNSTNGTPIVNEASNIAQANGVTVGEITNSSYGAVQAGQWNGTNFTAGAKPYNAVLVPAQRTVNLFFGPVVGLKQKVTAVHSVASLGGAENATDFIPFGVGNALVSGLTVGDQFTIDGKQSPGNWGKINPNGAYQNSNAWSDDMNTSGYNGVMAIGDTIQTITGVAKDANAWSGLVGDTVVIVIADNFTNGSGSIGVVGFALVKVISTSGNGNNLKVTFQLEPGLVNGSGGGPTNAPFASTRVLVQ